MLLGTDDNLFGLEGISDAEYARMDAAGPAADVGWKDRCTRYGKCVPIFSEFFPLVTSTIRSQNGLDQFRYDVLRTYRDVPIISDTDILLMEPLAAVQLFYEQFNISVGRETPDGWTDECASNRDRHNCPRFTDSAYTKAFTDAARARNQVIGWDGGIPTLWTYEQFWAQGSQGDPCYNWAPELPPGGPTTRGSLVAIAKDLMLRIYRLRPDLRFITNPETGEKVVGLMEPGALWNGVPNCQGEVRWTDMVGPIVAALFSAIMPAGIPALVLTVGQTLGSIAEMMEQRRKMQRLLEGIERITVGIPTGIQNIVNRRAVMHDLIPEDVASGMATDEEATTVARQLGLAYAPMICRNDQRDECTPATQKSLLQNIIDEWDTMRLLQRRSEWNTFRDQAIREATPDWNSEQWTKDLMGGNWCNWNPVSPRCATGAAGFRKWAAGVKADLYPPGRVYPPAPAKYKTYESIRDAYDRSTLDRIGEILAHTQWIPGASSIESLQNVIQPPPATRQPASPDIGTPTGQQASPANGEPSLPGVIPAGTIVTDTRVHNQPQPKQSGLLVAIAAVVAGLALS